MTVESPKFEGDPALKVWEALGDAEKVDIQIALAVGMSLYDTNQALASLHLAGKVACKVGDSGTKFWSRT